SFANGKAGPAFGPDCRRHNPADWDAAPLAQFMTRSVNSSLQTGCGAEPSHNVPKAHITREAHITAAGNITCP
ncbi:MAG: hypothetical protein IJM45_08125, partial [Clostridia bacterium]|nr:hypothetical protein [Clostridia bacterium]